MGCIRRDNENECIDPVDSLYFGEGLAHRAEVIHLQGLFEKFTPGYARSALVSVLASTAAGIFLLFSPLGDGLAYRSFDFPMRFRWAPPVKDVIIVTLDEASLNDTSLNDPKRFRPPFFDRSTHARFLTKLKQDGARLVVFDVQFKESTPEDMLLAAAITNFGNVILAADMESLGAEFAGVALNLPAPVFRGLPGCQIGLTDVQWDYDGIVREFPRERTNAPSMAMAAAAAVGRGISIQSEERRYIGFYGDAGTLPNEPYHSAFGRASGYFSNKVVFIGGRPKNDVLGAKADFFFTPFTRWKGTRMPGVELQATLFLNLVEDAWLTRLGLGGELSLVIASGVVAGLLLCRTRPLPGLAWAFGLSLAIAIGGILSFSYVRVWFDWLLMATVQVPAAWSLSALLYSVRLRMEKEKMASELQTIKSKVRFRGLPPAAPVGDIQPVALEHGHPRISNFELLKPIGEGAFGEVWLAQSLTGAYRAIKIVHRNYFNSQRPFEREFEGVQNFEPISRTHPGWVAILYVGKDEQAGFFYYVMEPADDLVAGSEIDPATYNPKTLSRLLVESGWLPVEDCVGIGITVAEAVGALHKVDLVHRDIKPSNIIFVEGSPKLADIGLVAVANATQSGAGTEGYIPQEGPGSPVADIFSLGRTLYQIATGSSPNRHPSLPTNLGERTDTRDLMRLMDIINKACAKQPSKRYPTAELLRDDLIKLQASLPRRRPKS